MNVLKLFVGMAVSVVMLLLPGCGKSGDFLVFSIENDKELGQKIAKQIAGDPSYEMLSKTTYVSAYKYLDDMMREILNSGEITYKDEFDWEINIIKGSDLHAFSTPGGRIYLYTGLLFFLDKEDDLAGVLGHEISHVDRRHRSKQLQRQYGISELLNMISGEASALPEPLTAQITGKDPVLAFSRSAESEADKFSVKYLSSTPYACNGATDVFQKLFKRKEETSKTPKFLRTHSKPASRVDAIDAVAATEKCKTTPGSDSERKYRNFRNSL